jgi:DNA-3-methyladenine glycosylase I
MSAPDGRTRCPWALTAPAYPGYLAYHDDEWGRPVRDDRGLYERLTLEAFQSGLAWITVLRKREAFRRAFAGFDPAVVAAYDEADVDRLLADPGIIRNRRKIEAAVTNAQVVLGLSGGLTDLLWSFAPTEPRAAPRTQDEVPAVTPESTAMARALRAQGLRFVGPTTAYALMQATGMVNDHVADCWCREVVDSLRRG